MQNNYNAKYIGENILLNMVYVILFYNSIRYNSLSAYQMINKI